MLNFEMSSSSADLEFFSKQALCLCANDFFKNSIYHSRAVWTEKFVNSCYKPVNSQLTTAVRWKLEAFLLVLSMVSSPSIAIITKMLSQCGESSKQTSDNGFNCMQNCFCNNSMIFENSPQSASDSYFYMLKKRNHCCTSFNRKPQWLEGGYKQRVNVLAECLKGF